MLSKKAAFVLLSLATAAFARDGGALNVGVAASPITPFLDDRLVGYFYERTADGVHDDLYAKSMVIDDGTTTIALVACDVVWMSKAVVADARARIQKRLGIPADHILISATHSHTGPELQGEFASLLARRISDSVVTAKGNAQPARLRVGRGEEASLPHHRRYLMKDGSTVTNPGFLNPNIVKPQGPIDPRVPVVVAENIHGKPLVTWVNYAMHLDTIGGTMISADYAFFLGRYLEQAKGREMITIFTIGAAGNINHWDVARAGPQRGVKEAARLGETLGAAVLKAFDNLETIEAPRLSARSAPLELSVPVVTEEEIAAMRKVLATPAPKNVDFTLDRVRASRTLALAALGGKLRTEIQVVAVGPIAFVAIPGELFVELGLEIQKASPFRYTFIVALANDGIGYIPTKEAFKQGGYEPTTSRLSPGGGELIVAQAVALLKQLHR
jgi:hypothetical protein